MTTYTFTMDDHVATVELTEDVLQARLTEDTVEVKISEGFVFGTSKLYTWEYATETERLAATGFTAGQVGYGARQSDDNSLWMLIAHDPPAWKNIGLGPDEMLKSVYDTDEDNIADEAQSIDGGSF